MWILIVVCNLADQKMWLPIQTDWGLFVRKSSKQLQSVAFRSRVLSLLSFSFMRDIVFNVELKSTNSILIQVLSSRCVKTEWREGDSLLCECVGSECTLVRVQAGRDVVFDALENHFIKVLHQNQGECYSTFPISPRSLQAKCDCSTEEASPWALWGGTLTVEMWNIIFKQNYCIVFVYFRVTKRKGAPYKSKR